MFPNVRRVIHREKPVNLRSAESAAGHQEQCQDKGAVEQNYPLCCDFSRKLSLRDRDSGPDALECSNPGILGFNGQPLLHRPVAVIRLSFYSHPIIFTVPLFRIHCFQFNQLTKRSLKGRTLCLLVGAAVFRISTLLVSWNRIYQSRVVSYPLLEQQRICRASQS
jgi:hypothetical protein